MFSLSTLWRSSPAITTVGSGAVTTGGRLIAAASERSAPAPTKPSKSRAPRRLLTVCGWIAKVLTGCVARGGTKPGFDITLTVAGRNQSERLNRIVGAVVPVPAENRGSALDSSVWPSVRRPIVTVVDVPAGSLASLRS